jgi:hypothetical protein
MWRNKLSQERGRREDAMARAKYYEESLRERTSAKLRSEDEVTREIQRRNAEEIHERVSHRRANSAALSRRMDQMRVAEERTAERKRAQLEDRLDATMVRHAQQVDVRRNSLAQQRSFRQAVQTANIRQLEKVRSDLSSRILEQACEQPNHYARSGSVATTIMSVRSSSRGPNHVAVTAQRAAEIQELKTMERLRKINEEEQRSQLAMARKQAELEQRRMQKSAREREAQARVHRRERLQELEARRYEAKFQEAVEIGNRVAAFNSICRSNF